MRERCCYFTKSTFRFRGNLAFGFSYQVQIFFFSVEIVIVRENFWIIKKEAAIESCSIKQVFFKKLLLNVATLNLCWGNFEKVNAFVQSQASYLQLYKKRNFLISIFQPFWQQVQSSYFAEYVSAAISESINHI